MCHEPVTVNLALERIGFGVWGLGFGEEILKLSTSAISMPETRNQKPETLQTLQTNKSPQRIFFVLLQCYINIFYLRLAK
jgi:hypothetical protein